MNSPHRPTLRRTGSDESTESHPSKTLLFGEIPSSPVDSGYGSLRSDSSVHVCNLVLSTNAAFLRCWLLEECRDVLISHIEKEDLPNFRLACHDFATKAAPQTFNDITITFRSSTFTKPARIAALDRIGHHVKTLTFNAPHAPETFLPPILDLETGEERSFTYAPQIQKPETLFGLVKQPKYGSWEITDLLVRQYPPLFHAATNVPAFMRAISAMPSISHLKISCPGQETAARYRRSTVDYALISLRIAVERSFLPELDTLTLQPIHPAALQYLQPMHGFGSTPGSLKRWRQIKNLTVHMESFPFDEMSHKEHLKLLQSYLRTFTPSLVRLFFRWTASKGPSPLTLDREPCMQPTSNPIANTTAHPASRPGTPKPPRPLRFARLKFLELENAVMDSAQIKSFITRHRHTLAEFSFEDITLRTGDWDDALSPLTQLTGNNAWMHKQEELMDVPICLQTPAGSEDENVEPRVMDQLLPPEDGDTEEHHQGSGLSRLFSRGKKAREQNWLGSGHMGKFLRGSVFPWR